MDFRSVPDSQANVLYPVSPPSFYISTKRQRLAIPEFIWPMSSEYATG